MSRPLESTAAAREEVMARNLDRRRGYAADGREGTVSRSQLGFWSTCLKKKKKKKENEKP